jgi:acyl-CoA dehydrogenase
VTAGGTIALIVAGLALAIAMVLLVPGVRRRIVTPPILRLMRRVLPPLSDTERQALEAGNTFFEAEIFSGKPRWESLLELPVQPLAESERAFVEGPVEELCAMLDDWAIEQSGDLPQNVWRFLKEHRFFGMTIPRGYGGLELSAAAHSAVVTKIASRSCAAAVTVMVPSSLGPGELLHRYGTEEQKQRYLPRLAQGVEIPCFALTEPLAGSDAASTRSTGVVCRGQYEGREVLGIRLNWSKRYITLGPIATLIGLAFQLRDPDRLLGTKEDLGITVALVPARLPGIEIGARHDPMGVAFQNGPNRGVDVFVPIDAIIGGAEKAGHGWQMLMECLAAGRAISLPALSVGAAELCARITGAYATVREQFDTPIGRFEGIEEPLARIGGLTYMMNAARIVTAGAIDAGAQPAVASAIVKCYLTEAMRAVVIDAMDVRAGAALCRGPRNALARAYVAAPLGITVEGANILTRSLIIYGQGAIRCHPYVQSEMRAVREHDLNAFDRAFFGHMAHALGNALRGFVLGLTGGHLVTAPVHPSLERSVQRMTRLSAALSVMSEAAMVTLGGSLKRREKLSGRLADALAYLYLGACVVKRDQDTGNLEATRPFAQWACEHAIFKAHDALAGVLDNLPSRFVAVLLRAVLFPWGARCRPPSDALGSEVARALLDDREGRVRLTADIFVPREGELGALESALHEAVIAQDTRRSIRAAARDGRIPRSDNEEVELEAALQSGVVSEVAAQQLHEAERAIEAVIAVDAFSPDRFPLHEPVQTDRV